MKCVGFLWAAQSKLDIASVQAPTMAPECLKHSVKHVCTNLEAGCAGIRTCSSLPVPNPNPEVVRAGRFVPDSTGLGESGKWV